MLDAPTLTPIWGRFVEGVNEKFSFMVLPLWGQRKARIVVPS